MVLNMKKLKSYCLLKLKKECREHIINEGIIKQEEAIDYDVNYYGRCEKLQEIDYIKNKPCIIFDFEHIECKAIKNVEHYELIDECCELIIHEMIEKIEGTDDKKGECNDDKKDECNELIDNKKDECCELINNQEVEITEDQKIDDINMLQSSRNESNKIKELGLTIKELKAIARKIGVKNYENLSRIRLVEEIDKLEPSKELKRKKIVSSLLFRVKKILDLNLKKSEQKRSIGIKSKKEIKNTRNC